jgi:hypothetical protein
MDTWGRHVFMPFIATDAADTDYPNALVLGDEGKQDLGGKTLQAFSKFCEYYDDGDFFVLADDDSFIVAHRVERYLRAYRNPEEPLYAGYTLTHTKRPFVGGGGGIVISRMTLYKFCEATTRLTTFSANNSELQRVQRLKFTTPCSWRVMRTLPGDIAVAECMKYLNIPATNIDGFQPFPLDKIVLRKPQENWCTITWWVPKHLKCFPPHPDPKTYHYVPVHEYGWYYILNYHLRKY